MVLMKARKKDVDASDKGDQTGRDASRMFRDGPNQLQDS
jgi:hypothetical protein